MFEKMYIGTIHIASNTREWEAVGVGWRQCQSKIPIRGMEESVRQLPLHRDRGILFASFCASHITRLDPIAHTCRLGYNRIPSIPLM